LGLFIRHLYKGNGEIRGNREKTKGLAYGFWILDFMKGRYIMAWRFGGLLPLLFGYILFIYFYLSLLECK